MTAHYTVSGFVALAISLQGLRAAEGEPRDSLGQRIANQALTYLLASASNANLRSPESEKLIKSRIAQLAETVRWIPEAEVQPELAAWINQSVQSIVERNAKDFLQPGGNSAKSFHAVLELATNRFKGLNVERGRLLLASKQSLQSAFEAYHRELSQYIGSVFGGVSTLRITFDRRQTNHFPSLVEKDPLGSVEAKDPRQFRVCVITNSAEADAILFAFVSDLRKEIHFARERSEGGLVNIFSGFYDASPGEAESSVKPFSTVAERVRETLASAVKIMPDASMAEVNCRQLAHVLGKLSNQRWERGSASTSVMLAPRIIEVPNKPDKWSGL